jgi:GNAT superfamily N-acetyltransferase
MIHIRQATAADTQTIHAMLVEASQWVDALGIVMWQEGEADQERIAAEVEAGQFYIAILDREPAGIIRFQLEDALFWPDIPPGRSAFVHRLVAPRRFKGRGVSTALLEWAANHARELGRETLRLDCDAHREKLRQLYERFGFVFHDLRQVGPHLVARYVYDLH